MGTILIKNANIVNRGSIKKASVLVKDNIIQSVGCTDTVADRTIDADGMFLLPGIIDDHVHFRDPGLTHKATMASESRLAALGGVTTIFDMPNTKPQTTTLQALEDKFSYASDNCLVNYSFYLGATNDNIAEIEKLQTGQACGVKLFMGSSTGNMLVDGKESLNRLFSASPVIIAAHCEDQQIIEQNIERYKKECQGEPSVEYHHLIRSIEACYSSTSTAIELANNNNARLHVMHVSTDKELSLFEDKPLDRSKKITAEFCPHHLFFTDKDMAATHGGIKCNPAIKGEECRKALRSALSTDKCDVVGTDHAPHLWSEKQGGALTAASGMPVLPYSLNVMLELMDLGYISITQIVGKMAHNPATLFGIQKRGFIEPGYFADLVLVAKESFTADGANLPSICKWSPFTGHRFDWKVKYTLVNGNIINNCGVLNTDYRGQRVKFE